MEAPRKILAGSIVLARIDQGWLDESVLRGWLRGSLARSGDRAACVVREDSARYLSAAKGNLTPSVKPKPSDQDALLIVSALPQLSGWYGAEGGFCGATIRAPALAQGTTYSTGTLLNFPGETMYRKSKESISCTGAP